MVGQRTDGIEIGFKIGLEAAQFLCLSGGEALAGVKLLVDEEQAAPVCHLLRAARGLLRDAIGGTPFHLNEKTFGTIAPAASRRQARRVDSPAVLTLGVQPGGAIRRAGEVEG